MRSKDFRKYIIVTKKPNFTVHEYEEDLYPESVTELINRGQDKTFWMFSKEDGELVGRYSIESAPQWVMEIYDILTKSGTEDRGVGHG